MKTIKIDGRDVPANEIDITGKVGPLYFSTDTAEWTMYSFGRPAYNFWNGIAKGMAKQGATTEEIQWWLQSKWARWLLDSMDGEIEKMGEKYGKKVDMADLRKTIKYEAEKEKA